MNTHQIDGGMSRRTALKGGIVLALTAHTPAVAMTAPAVIIPTLEEKVAFNMAALEAVMLEATGEAYSRVSWKCGCFNIVSGRSIPETWKSRDMESWEMRT